MAASTDKTVDIDRAGSKPRALIDPFRRAITYLRVSVTDRCDFRCVYCMAENMAFLPKADLLSLEELDRLCGVERINVSLDTLDAEKFRAITRWGDLGKVLDGIDAAQAAGLRVKINAVALKGVNDDEITGLVAWAHGRGMDLTVIEVMPLGDIGEERLEQYLPLSMVRPRLAERYTLEDIEYSTGGPARYVRVKETGGRLGFITPMTHNFCESCNRVRLTCTGTLYMCLGQDDAADLRAPLRASESNDLVHAAIDEAITRKPRGHDFVIDRRHRRPALARHMSVTGG
jgi:cyclic pyranopterin phosphate synthase